MGPLEGVRIVEIAGLGAAPYGCMMLADMGAEVVRVDRIGGSRDTPEDSPLLRNRRSVTLDLKSAAGREAVLALCEKADVIVEGFRPGVMERLGLGPEPCLARNPRLVYARMTGWGQTGPLSQAAGHDLNYIGLTGLLHQIGPAGGKPAVPLNVIGDFGGGGLLMAFGVVCALLETRKSGQGQVVDAAMIDGALSFMAMSFGFRELGLFPDRPGTQLLGGGAHYYNVYEARDGRYLSVASVEPQFYRSLVETLAETTDLDRQRWLGAGYPALTRETIERDWPAFTQELTRLFKTRDRDDWVGLFEGKDACVTPILSLAEAPAHPHNRARELFIEVGGVQQQAPAPRFSRTAPTAPQPPPRTGADTETLLAAWGIDPSIAAALKR